MLCNVLIIDSRKVLSTKYKKALTDENTSVDIANSIKDALFNIQSKAKYEAFKLFDSESENLFVVGKNHIVLHEAS